MYEVSDDSSKFMAYQKTIAFKGLNDLNSAVHHYKDVLKQDSTNIEAIACIATNHFYSDQPEIALRFYR